MRILHVQYIIEGMAATARVEKRKGGKAEKQDGIPYIIWVPYIHSRDGGDNWWS